MLNSPSLSINSGFRVAHPAFQGWEALLEEWLLLIERYCRLAPGKAPYWWNERASVGLLAGAAWRCGWISLEEFQAEKSAEDMGWRGRLDLWLASTTASYVVEAKQGWPVLGSTNALSTIGDTLGAATADAANLVLTEPQTRVGVAFCAPYLSCQLSAEVEPALNHLLEALSDIPHDAMAWCFPRCTRNLIDSTQKHVYPGVILLARVADLHNKTVPQS